MAIADVLQKLDDPMERAAVIEALKAAPAAHKYLRKYVHSKTSGSMLRPMEAWVLDSL